MLATLTRNWWAILIRGIAALAFGIIALWHPILAGVALIVLFGAYAFVDGIFAIVAAMAAARAGARWWPLVVEGIVGLAVAGFTYFEPGVTALALYWTIAAWAMLTGILELVAAVRLRQEIRSEFFLILSGIASIVFGVLLYAQPLVGALAVIVLIGVYAIVFGVLLIALSWRLRQGRAVGG